MLSKKLKASKQANQPFHPRAPPPSRPPAAILASIITVFFVFVLFHSGGMLWNLPNRLRTYNGHHAVLHRLLRLPVYLVLISFVALLPLTLFCISHFSVAPVGVAVVESPCFFFPPAFYAPSASGVRFWE
jgi:hypothetical protein